MTREDKQGIAIIITLVLLGLVAFYATYRLKPKQYNIDARSLCAKDKVVTLKKIVLIDKSDRWSQHNIEKLENWLSEMHEGIVMNRRLNILSIFADEHNRTNVKTLFDKCSPGSERDCNALYENCREIKANYDHAFEKPLLEITNMLAEPDETKTSPLFETMTEIIDDIQSQEAEIHIISDFMENGYRFNFYKALPSDAKIRVYMHIIERRKHKRETIDGVKKLWRGYFEKQGIEVVKFKRFFIAE